MFSLNDYTNLYLTYFDWSSLPRYKPLTATAFKRYIQQNSLIDSYYEYQERIMDNYLLLGLYIRKRY